MKADRFFSDVERDKIRAVIEETETRTIGEVVIDVADQSDLYSDTEIIGGILVGACPSLILTILFFHSSVLWFIPLCLLFFFPSYFLLRKWPRLKTAFLGAHKREHAVKERAVRAFYEHGLYKTREHTGVLFFISLLERKVWVLADSGIYEKIGQGTLDQYAAGISSGIKKGRACDALCQAIRDVGLLLAQHFPIKPGDINELPDSVIIEK